GIWKSVDSGVSWTSVADGQLGTGSVGAIAVSESDPNVLYAGMGEGCIRGNVSHGDGVYKSVDAGRTWKNVGLRDSRQIGRVRIDPRDPDVRSEEHTSELQSRSDLVCRLLLEKKKK